MASTQTPLFFPPVTVPLLRGSRFAGDSASVVFYITRSKNANVVVYDAQPGAPDREPVHPYWLDIDPEYVAKNRAKGKLDDIEELNIVERKMAYGVTCTRVAPTDLTQEKIDVSFVALPTKRMHLVWRPNVLAPLPEGNPQPQATPILFVEIAGVMCVAHHAFVQSVEPKHFWNLPTVEFVDIFGVNQAGEMVTERLTNK